MLLPDGLGESKGTKGIVVMRGETGGGDLYRTSGHADFKKTGINIADLACNAPPNKSKHFLLIYGIYKSYGIGAGKLWVATIDQ